MRVPFVVVITTSLLMVYTAAFLDQLGFSKTDLSRTEYKQLKQYYRQSTQKFLENSELPPTHFVPRPTLSNEEMEQIRLKYGSTRDVGALLRKYTDQRYSPYYTKAMSKAGRLSRDLGISLMRYYGNHANPSGSLASRPPSVVSETETLSTNPSTPPLNPANHTPRPSSSATHLASAASSSAQVTQSLHPDRTNDQGITEKWDEDEQRYLPFDEWYEKQRRKNRQKRVHILGHDVIVPSLGQSSTYQSYTDWKDDLPNTLYKKKGEWLKMMQQVQHRPSGDQSSDQDASRRKSA
ncbi:hypothetical protein H4R34_002667 [Dimargaris verticillata]|uniref:Uncharacterized protein n=1 Tax=Dimargaris verticillata TaxID=2761393 RepID=A0A9W8EDC7_9FUNG|nr:hypothetical protein H4R34_002667 [Dimargaris verticillata]